MTLSLGILSWKAHATLEKTLMSYRAQNLFSLFDESVIHFNAISDDDRALAQRYALKASGTADNRGLLLGTRCLAQALTGEYLLMLQNDCPLVEDHATCARMLSSAVKLLDSGKADIVRMRHRWNTGEGFSDVEKYLAYYPCHKVAAQFVKCHGLPSNAHDSPAKKLKRILRHSKAVRMIGRAPYVEEEPEKVFPKYISREGDFLIVDSAVINFTDQPFLVSKKFLLRLFDYALKHPSTRTLNGFQVLEIILNCSWWRRRHFKVAVGEGLFTHNRFDDSFRKDHHAFNSGLESGKI